MIMSSPNAKYGAVVAFATAIATALTFGIAIATPPLSGPLCAADCIAYPFADIASRFPRDYYWMYPAIVATGMYFILMAYIHAQAPQHMKPYSYAAYGFALLSGGILVADYFVQLAVIQPSVLLGETDGLALLTQYNPHGVFIALEELGYLLMAVSFAFLVPLFDGRGIARWIRRTLVASVVLGMGSLLYFWSAYGMEREYRFEIAIISICWIAVIVWSTLFGISIMKKANQ